MKIIEKFSQSISGMAMEGALMALSPLPFLLLFVRFDGEKPHLWRLIIASVAATAAFSGGLMLFRRPLTGKLFCGIAAFGYAVFLSLTDGFPTIALLISLFSLVTMPDTESHQGKKERWWEILLNHPARILLSTISALSVFGTLLLTFPIATRTGTIQLLRRWLSMRPMKLNWLAWNQGKEIPPYFVICHREKINTSPNLA